MSDRLKIEVLGPLRVTRGAKNVKLPASKKTRALLAYLAVTGRPHSRNHLCDLLWETPADPRASLRWSLHKIKGLLTSTDIDCLDTAADTVFLNPKGFDFDFPEVDRARIADLDTGGLEHAAGLFCGRFLEGLDLPHCQGFEAWRTYHVEHTLRLRSRILHLLVKRLEAEPERALFHARTLQGIEPEARDLAERISHSAGLASRSEADSQQDRLTVPTSEDRAEQPETDLRYCTTPDGVRIAFAVSGTGLPLMAVVYSGCSPHPRGWRAARPSASQQLA